MSVHDGILFLDFTRGKQTILLNPSLVASIEDASEAEKTRRKSTAKSMALVWFVGADITDSTKVLAFDGFTTKELAKHINDKMKSYKDKLADEALLS